MAIKILLTDKVDSVKLVDRRNIFALYKSKTNWEGEINDFSEEIFRDVLKEIFTLAGKNITEKRIVLQEIKRALEPDLGTDAQYVIDLFSGEVSTDEIIQYRQIIEQEITAIEVYPTFERIENLLLLIRSTSGQTRAKYLAEYEQLIHKTSSGLKQVQKASSGLNSVLFSDSGLDELIEATHDELNNPSANLRSASSYINDLLTFSTGTLTILGAPSGHFKSGFLLNLALGFCESNNNILLKDQTKLPFVQYIAFENKQTLTFRRIGKYKLGMDNETLKTTSKELLKQKMREKFDGDSMAFKLDYRKSYTISPEDILALVTGVTNEKGQAMECVAIVIDYMFIMDVDMGDLRLSLSRVSRGLADIAIEEAIPVITAIQLNGEAELSKFLTKRSVGESKAIIDHADDAFLFRLEEKKPLVPVNDPRVTSPTKKFKYLEGYLIKARSNEDHDTGRQILPFMLSNNFRIADDFHDSTFALFPKDQLENDLDLKYGITKTSKNKSAVVMERDGEQGSKAINKNPLLEEEADDNPYQ